MKYRNESKHLISQSDKATICHRLGIIASLDKNASADGSYLVRSLYFDNIADKALREKIDGVNEREKFRIRYYNGDTGWILLEKKSKQSGLCNKQSVPLTRDEAQAIVDNDLQWMPTSGRPLVIEQYSKMKAQGLRPKTIVEYTRIPYVYGPGNVRITLDFNIRTGLRRVDFLNPGGLTIPAGDPAIVLEVKWDEYLPSVIRKAIQLDSRHSVAFSKYQTCRIYG